ncbi:MAG: hypothetical protein IT319_06965 [Anaerolineae bacterium]|nr:hypothetical protein [Anaerolineae bacterium]
MNTRSRKPDSATASGVFPKPDFSASAPQESPETPPPEHETDPGSITGVLPIVPEGKDDAKNQDDSAAGKRQ